MVAMHPRKPVATRRRRSRHCRSRHGLTLVEMMVSIALTLMVVFALVQVFELLGNNVTDGRATMGMSGSLRRTANLLRDDLAGLTVTTRPWRDTEQSDGYFEVIDGPGTDAQSFVRLADGTLEFVRTASGFDTNQDGFLDQADGIPFDTSAGDMDDFLAFTSRNATNPFKGTISHPAVMIPVRNPLTNRYVPTQVVNTQAPTRVIDSPEAEIVWWLQVERNPLVEDIQQLANMSEAVQLANAVSDSNSIGGDAARIALPYTQRYPNSTATTMGTPVRSLHRRVLLIRPDLDLSFINLKTVDDVSVFLSNNDLSVSVSWSESESAYKVSANSLGDLALRHNRAFRKSFAIRGTEAQQFVKKRTPINTLLVHGHDGEMMPHHSLLLRQAAMKDMVIDPMQTGQVFMIRRGRDVVLSDAMGFDLQVWDPKAIVKLATDGSAVSPSDPGYLVNLPNNASIGAYVDLGYALAPKATTTFPTNFAGEFGGPQYGQGIPAGIARSNGWSSPSPGWATYCTWCADYEHDGVNQSTRRSVEQRYNTLNITPNSPADEGENGFDDDGVNGVDDPGERETSPPYPHALRGLKVTMRVMDANTRQVRQTSVVTDFLPE